MKSGKFDGTDRHRLWAELRFSVIGHLLASPPGKGELKICLEDLATRSWIHPIRREPTLFGMSTIERWYYRAAKAQSPVDALRRKVRIDAGTMTVFGEKTGPLLIRQYKDHPSWSYQLQCDNLRVLIEALVPPTKAPSYCSVKRFMKVKGLFKKKKSRNDRRPAAIAAFESSQRREKRLFEAPFPHSLWHLDYHHASRQIIEPDGQWHTPLCVAFIDDNSRLGCHIQWYLAEDAECLVHGFIQAIQKRGLPRELMTDNGSAMKSEEFTSGLTRLGITWSPTLPYSPNQNGKQEVFWATLEGRLMAMLENIKNLTLKQLNDATIAWIEMEYNRATHSETKMTPVERIKAGKDQSRPSPDTETVMDAFCREVTRTQRRSDGTAQVEGRRFEVPSRYRNLEHLRIRYPAWDLSRVYIVDPVTGKKVANIYPVDLASNALSGRRSMETDIFKEPTELPRDEAAPLLKKLMAEYAATGLPPAYIPKYSHEEESK